MRSSALSVLLLLASAALPAQQYFPPAVLGRTPAEEQANAEWYTKHLKALHEPSLWELSRTDAKAEVYRFLWLRSFHHPIAVRLVVRPSGSGWLNARMTSGQGGYQTGRISRYSKSWLTKAKTQSFLAAIDSVNFWNTPTLEETGSAVHLDGAQWILEGVKGGQYHIVDRWSPESPDPIRDVGLLALRMARFRIRRGEIY
ncbi:MAG TPA: hypothetical protein VMH81_08390 [Bryobacteraceae bacterium]|nr:hypothetical protein [Bryobacteraceae bacterium]